MSDFFERLGARAPAAPAGWRDGSLVSHGELLARARAWAALGRRTGARDVALYLDDSLEFAAALLGAWLAGKTVWLVADTLPASCAALAAEVGAFWGEFPQDYAPCIPQTGDDSVPGWTTPAPDFPALVVHTSGSTGAPTAIRKRFSQLSSEIAALETEFGALVGDATVLSTVSHHHIYGLLFRVLWPLLAGRPVEAARHEFPETLAPRLGAGPCLLLASPAHLKRLPEHLDWRGAAQLRAVFSSGGMLEAEASFHARALLGQAPIEVYGSSETGGVAWRQRTPGSVEDWTPFPGVEWRSDAEGLLELSSGPAGGWQRLADRVEGTQGGRFVLRGRADRIVKIEEKRVSLDAIEASLCATGLVREARVLACLEGARQSLAAFVVPSDSGQALLEEGGRNALSTRLRAALAASTHAVALPRRWRYLERLPVNAQGKTTQADLLALLDTEMPARPRFPQAVLIEDAPARKLLELVVPADLLYFDGHFTVAPVLPGVVQVDWAIHYGRLHLGLAGSFGGINALKFQQMIRPGVPVQLELVWDPVKGSLNFRYFSEAGAHASGRILLGT
jgi:acyl-coenzyme A synthetase/AMP-(fatty) acid ligase/3-hydroxymyristoyl/3-hydroxydecanoyl-(acyl carrier protein) dehydratase